MLKKPKNQAPLDIQTPLLRRSLMYLDPKNIPKTPSQGGYLDVWAPQISFLFHQVFFMLSRPVPDAEW